MGKEETAKISVRINKICPKCKTHLADTIFNNAEVDYCEKCLGLWFQKDELRWAKDEKDKELIWMDVNIWDNEKEFKVSPGIRACPECRVPLYEVHYGSSKIIVDVCNLCYGVWLDRGEFIKIVDWLKEQKNYGVLNNYSKNLFKQAAEIFTGPETLREEILDFIAILKVLNYKLAAQYPAIARIISNLPK